MKGADSSDKDTANLIFTRSAKYFRTTLYTRYIAMTGMGMTQSNDISSKFDRGVTYTFTKGVGNQGYLFTLDSKTGVPQPGDFHNLRNPPPPPHIHLPIVSFLGSHPFCQSCSYHRFSYVTNDKGYGAN